MPKTLADLDQDLPVPLVCTALTTAVSLLDRGHRAPITALSYRDLIPGRHAAAGIAVPMPEADAFPTPLAARARSPRRADERQGAAGGRRHAVIDEIRPMTATPAGDAVARPPALPPPPPRLVERPSPSRLRPDRRSHRQGARRRPAPHPRLSPAGGPVEVVFRPRFQAHEEAVTVGRVINCAGPGADHGRTCAASGRT